MNRTPAVVLLVVICAILAGLLLRDVITRQVAAVTFASALVGLGIASRGFRGAGGR